MYIERMLTCIFGKAGLEPEQLRPAALRSLGGFFAAAESLAEAAALQGSGV